MAVAEADPIDILTEITRPDTTHRIQDAGQVRRIFDKVFSAFVEDMARAITSPWSCCTSRPTRRACPSGPATTGR